MKHTILDLSSNKVCLRCSQSGEVIMPEYLPISQLLVDNYKYWVQRYEEINQSGCDNYSVIDSLEKEGIKFMLNIKKEASHINLVFQSDTLTIELFGDPSFDILE
ncbi:hypothetical protein J2Y45_004696 [Dyadobacter sp. BE34]|uniref:Uncharacterized protein n=1 Tax=Dyadobacter fermentans TaxID=94254 RepID=A0ABU1R265_9BACT|nr:hypothetical protein [Dyadobacter fermentans]MDR7045237.1 hypothetical protein [Dyadobacter sp. BE242]MDR7199550.1 hypothetical protein [Dyadobacter sp. BE34]MDR7217991.1 hypothetical protein [Dyadobacter sp. BE31]MDR7265441.1 hypothetical protein [Dyadobacter sp. BE32]